MKVLYHNRNPVPSEKLQDLVRCTVDQEYRSFADMDLSFPKYAEVGYEQHLEALLAKSDCVALSLPLNAKTKGFFDKEKVSQMKNGAILINTARGGVLEEEALIAALDSGKVCARLPALVEEAERAINSSLALDWMSILTSQISILA